MVFNCLTLEIGQNSGLLRRDPSRDFACIYLSMIKPEFVPLDVAGKTFLVNSAWNLSPRFKKPETVVFSCV